MSAFANLPISRKLMAAFAAVVGIILVSSAILYDRLRVIELAKNARIHTTDVLETLQDIMDAMVDQETGVRGYLIAGDEKFLEPHHKGIDAYTAAIQKAKELTRDNPAQQSRLDELNELAKNWREIAEREIALMAKPETSAAARGLEGSTVGGKATMDLVRAKVDEIDGVERDLLAKREAVQKRAFATAYTMTILGGVASLIIAALMGVLLMRSIAVPITRMTGAMTALAKGDTTVAVPGVGRSDEIGAMATAAQIFKDNMLERQRAQAELARVGRLTTMGELVASIAHEVNQPLAAILANGDAGLRWLNRDEPDLDEVWNAVSRITEDARRAGKMIENLRALAKKSEPQFARLDVNGAILEILALTRSELAQHDVVLRTDLSAGDRLVFADRVQLQQVMLNLIINGIEAMSAVMDRPKVLTISSEGAEPSGVLVAVKDTGAGIDPATADRIFESFSRRSPTVWAWDFPSAVQLSRPMASVCGRRPTLRMAPSFSSGCQPAEGAAGTEAGHILFVALAREMSRWSAPKRTYRSIVNLMLSAAPRAHSSVSDLGAPLNEERLSGPAEGSSLDVERVGPRAICQEK